MRKVALCALLYAALPIAISCEYGRVKIDGPLGPSASCVARPV